MPGPHLRCHSIPDRRGPGTLRPPAYRLLLKLQLLLLLLPHPDRTEPNRTEKKGAIMRGRNIQ